MSEGSLLRYHVCGNGFLYNMVRIMVGTMLGVARGYQDISSISEALSCPSRELAGDTAPAHGLCLSRVEYALFDTDDLISSR